MFALPFGIVMLLAGLWGGLARLGFQLPISGTSAAEHGVLMSLGFLGTLISTERAVALGRAWAWAVPAASVLGSALLLTGREPKVGQALLLLAGLVLVAVYVRLDRIQRSTHNTLMGLAAVGWAVAAALWLGGRAVYSTVPWLAIFLVVTITAERLELSRMMRRTTPVRVSLVVAILGMVAGATVSIFDADLGVRLCGVAMVAMAVWLGIYDLARRTVRQRGVTRFMAVGLLAGYVWLAAGGMLWAIGGFQLDNAKYDAQLHMIFLGFVMSMVFAHAPVIAPAVIRRPLPYYPAFYGPLALLHVGLLLRVVVGDGAGVVGAWQWGGVLDEVAILAFVGVTVAAFARARYTHAHRAAAAAGPRPDTGAATRPDGARGPAILTAASVPGGFGQDAAADQPAAPPAGTGDGVAPSATETPNDLAEGPPMPPTHRRRLASSIAGAAIGVVILIAGIVFANSGPSGSGAAEGSSGGSAGSTFIDSAAAAAGVAISLVEMRIEPSAITVPPGTHLVLKVTNNGIMRHDLRLADGKQTPMLDPGQSAVLDVGAVDASMNGWCTVPGHRQAGMTMRIDVGHSGPSTGSPPSGAASSAGAMAGMSGMAGMGGPGQPSSSDAVSSNLAAAPPAGWKPIDASLPPAPGETVHNVTWHVKDVQQAVAPDVTQLMWTFDGRVPGPALRGKVGDRFNVTVVNDTDMTHNIDFHAESGPPAKVMTPVPAGGTHTYSFIATHAGAWLYHCSVEPMLLHLGNGMYGALIIDPPDLPPAAAEFVLVGSELFFGPQRGIGDYAKMVADTPDAVVFNGYPFAYQHAPLKAKAGELVRIWVINAGPTRPIAFHVIGAPFTTVYLDGAYLLRDGRSAGVTSGGAQSLPVDPGDGGFVELTFSEPGSYPFLTHAMANAVIGASGTFTVTG